MPSNVSRRQFLFGAAALGAIGALPVVVNTAMAKSPQLIVSAARDVKGHYVLAALDLDGNLVSKTRLPKRAHDSLALPHKPNHVLVLARRPDTFAIEINVLTGDITNTFNSEEGRHFYGHGVVSPDGALLYTSENNYEAQTGEIVVRQTSDYKVVNRFSSGGIGPHELALMPDQEHLVIANGGIITHPDMPRLKLNLDSMQPNLSYVNRHTGEVVEQVYPEHYQQSARHLVVSQQGDVYLGMQFNGDYNLQFPLVYHHKRGQQLVAMKATEEQWQSMHQYIASLCVTDDTLYVTCPRGDRVAVWDRHSRDMQKIFELKDAAGLALESNRVIMSSGAGTLLNGQLQHETAIASIADIQFDNHMTLMFSA